MCFIYTDPRFDPTLVVSSEEDLELLAKLDSKELKKLANIVCDDVAQLVVDALYIKLVGEQAHEVYVDKDIPL